MATATASLPLPTQHRRGRAYVALAAVAWSTAGILQRELSVGVPTQLAGRAFFAVLAILTYVAVSERGALVRAFRAIGGGGLAVAALMAVSAVSFAALLVITRHRRDVSMAPATALSQLVVLVLAAPFASPGQIGGRDLLLLVGLGVGQIGLGLIFLTIGARLIPAAEVALITLLEIVLGPLWVWIFLSEQPSATTLAGGAIVLAAVVVQAQGAPPEEASVAPP